MEVLSRKKNSILQWSIDCRERWRDKTWLPNPSSKPNQTRKNKKKIEWRWEEKQKQKMLQRFWNRLALCKKEMKREEKSQNDWKKFENKPHASIYIYIYIGVVFLLSKKNWYNEMTIFFLLLKLIWCIL